MTHVIEGFIGKADHLKDKTKELKNVKLVPLAQGFAFLPFGNKLYEEISKVSKRPMMWLAGKLRSRSSPIAWVETDYFGGFGNQSAILWKNGKKERFKGDDGSGGHIDDALKELGVVVHGEHDEFDALGLGKYRTTDAWLGEDRGYLNKHNNDKFI